MNLHKREAYSMVKALFEAANEISLEVLKLSG